MVDGMTPSQRERTVDARWWKLRLYAEQEKVGLTDDGDTCEDGNIQQKEEK